MTETIKRRNFNSQCMDSTHRMVVRLFVFVLRSILFTDKRVFNLLERFARSIKIHYEQIDMRLKLKAKQNKLTPTTTTKKMLDDHHDDDEEDTTGSEHRQTDRERTARPNKSF